MWQRHALLHVAWSAYWGRGRGSSPSWQSRPSAADQETGSAGSPYSPCRVLKGISGSVRASAALRPSSVESRFEALHAGGLTYLVGRDEELGATGQHKSGQRERKLMRCTLPRRSGDARRHQPGEANRRGWRRYPGQRLVNAEGLERTLKGFLITALVVFANNPDARGGSDGDARQQNGNRDRRNQRDRKADC